MRKPSLFRRLVTSVLVANCVILAPYGPPLAHATSTVVIGEVAWAGSSVSTADEWIELWNLGDTPAEIGGYKLQQGVDGTVTFPTDVVIPPRSAYLVSNYAASDSKSVLATTPQFVTTAVSLSNSALSITLLDATDGVVDQVGTGGKPPAGSSGTIKATMIRTSDTWVSATTSQGFDEGRTELGTPGVCDECHVPEPVPVVIESLPIETPIAAPPVVATSTEPAADSVASTSTDVTTTPTVETPTIEPPVVEPIIVEATVTPVIPPCQALPAEQPISVSEETEPPSTPSPDATNFELPLPIVVTDAVTTSTDPVLSVPPSVEPSTTMVTDPILVALEPIIDLASVAPSSTEPTALVAEQVTLLSNDVTTSSAQTAPDPVIETVTTTVSVPADTSTDVAPTETTSTESTATNVTVAIPASSTPIAPRYDLLRLNEFNAHPIGENEWIEITSLDATASIALDGVMFYDAAGKIFTFATGTLDGVERFATATLSSSRLNNDGDTIYLKDPNGIVLDSVHYEGSKAGWTWDRLPDGMGTWIETSSTTFGDINIAPPTPAVETPVQTPSSTQTIASPSTATAPTTSPTSISSTPKKTVTKTKETKISTVKETTTPPKTTTIKTTTKTTTTKSTKAAPTNKSATKTTSIPTISFDMNDYETSRGIRVSLQGQVGSPSGLLSSHAFILLSPDGRGLQVRVPTAKKLPDLNEIVVVQGTLLFTDVGMPYLKLGTNDDWKTITDASQTTKSRDANLFTPSAEDAWSLVSATGTVRHIGASSATIEIDGADVDVTIKKIIQYRLSRLSVGDTVSVTGLLDVSSDVPKIVPRNEQEIALVAHVRIQPAKGNPTGLPGWTPFGAAGVAIAGTEGFKQLRDRRKRRTLEEIVETRLNTTV